MTEMQSLRLRSAKARRKAIFAGILYLIGTVGLAVAAFLPLTVGVEVGAYGAFGVANFWRPIYDVCVNFSAFIAAPADYVLSLVASLLYTVTLIFTVINALRSISRWDHLCMKGSKRIGFNQNKLAVDAMGKIYACSFSLVVVNTLLTMAIFPEGATFSLIGIIVGGAGLLIHFVATPVAASISKFTTRETVAEMPRKHGMFSVLLRNFFQIVAIFWIAFFLSNHQRGIAAFLLTMLASPVQGWNFLVGLFTSNWANGLLLVLYMVFWLVGLICFLVMLCHAVKPTEYYACGDKAKGRKVIRFHALTLVIVLFLTVLAPIVLAWIVSGFPSNVGEFFLQNLQVVYAMAVALGLFIIECIMKNYPKLKKKYREKTEESAEEGEKDDGQEPLVDDVPEEDSKDKQPKEEEKKEPESDEKPTEQKKEKKEKKEEPAPAPSAPLPVSPRAKQARAAKQKWINKALEAKEKAKEAEQTENKQ